MATNSSHSKPISGPIFRASGLRVPDHAGPVAGFPASEQLKAEVSRGYSYCRIQNHSHSTIATIIVRTTGTGSFSKAHDIQSIPSRYPKRDHPHISQGHRKPKA